MLRESLGEMLLWAAEFIYSLTSGILNGEETPPEALKKRFAEKDES